MFGEQFYPTPKDVADLMINKLDLSQIKNVLEPSAGKGDLIEALHSRIRKSIASNYSDSYEGDVKYYACEIDYNLRKILQASHRIKIIGFDFSDFNTNILQFDTIIMNPPFSEGCKHLLRAWGMLDKGQIVCLLNEETIKNPFSKERKLLLKIIEDNNGEIEYLETCFEGAERKTKVKVAMVTLRKEKGNIDNIFKDIKKEYLNEYTAFINGDALDYEIIQSGKDDIEKLIINNQLLKRETIRYLKAEVRYKHYVKHFSNSRRFNENEKEKEEIERISLNLREEINKRILEINEDSWSSFFSNTEIRNKMTEKTYKDFLSEYEDCCIDFNRKNIGKVIDIVVAMQGKIFEESVVEIFDLFTKYYDENREHIEGWKTNEAWKVGKRVILPYWFEVKTRNDGMIEPCYKIRGKRYDIDKVFANISGKQIGSFYGLRDLLDYSKILIPGERYDTEFFKVKGYKKGTIHIEFKDKDIRDRFNYIVCASKNWLPRKASK